MRRLLLLLFFWPFFLQASSDFLFPEEEDACIFHHVNVISGNLNLGFQDVQVPGAVPYSLTRTYSSIGALERSSSKADTALNKACNDWLIQEGWNFLPHINLFKQETGRSRDDYFFLVEKSGSSMNYERREQSGHHFTYAPDSSSNQSAGCLHARNDQSRNVLHYDAKNERVTLDLADGGKRFYERRKNKEHHHLHTILFQLVKEVSPDQHETHYEYNKHNHLTSIRLTGPDQRITFSSIHFNHAEEKNLFPFEVRTSCDQVLTYHAMEFKECAYLSGVDSNCRAREVSHYIQGRRGQGARMHAFHLADKHQFTAHYYEPSSTHLDKKIQKHPKTKELSIDKVRRLEAPLGPHGEIITLADFAYFPDHTDVRDSDQLLTRYHHDSTRLLSIDYFDEKEQLHSSLRFFWEGSHLIGKAFLGPDLIPLFSKVFIYNEAGDVIQETFYGNLSGKARGPFSLKEKGALENAESYSKYYTYDPQSHLPLTEREEEGVAYHYTYKPGTSLLSSKLTLEGENVLLREFLLYDDNNLLICEISDDGQGRTIDDLSGVSERLIERYTLHPGTGLPIELRETVLDKGTEKLLKRQEFTYSSQNRIIAETLYDATDTYCYTLRTEYDSFGHVISKTTPSGYVNTYTYNSQGELLTSKEEGALEKEYTYNLAGLPITRTEVDALGEKRTFAFLYDAKGRLLNQITPEGSSTDQQYDVFGHCIKTIFPAVKDLEGRPFRPEVHFSYDALGNLTETTTSQSTNHSLHNSLRKSIVSISGDNALTSYTYDIRGLLVETVYPDLTAVRYTYDALQRKTAETVYSSTGDVLSEETWGYNSFHLLSHTHPQGATTVYTYDASGKLLSEQTEGREISYEYDALGFLEKTTQGALSHVEKHSSSGRVVQQWSENTSGHIENHMTFLYDEEGRKIQATRLTSQGEALDFFSYDARGRFCSHTDPLGATTQFIQRDVPNDLGQLAPQKTTIDPLLNRKIETYDALGHLISEERQNALEQPVARSDYAYDSAGDCIQSHVTVFDKTTPLRDLVTEWDYDACGRVIKEMQRPGKVSTYTYDLRGQIASKTLPSGICFHYTYDGLGRLLEQASSDGSVHYKYDYARFSAPIRIEDVLQKTTLLRSYNIFEEVAHETNPLGLNTEWNYDDLGRCIQLVLPDQSQIQYVYEGAHLKAVQRISKQGALLYEHKYEEFDPNGHVAKETLIQGLGTLLTSHDLLERPLTQTSPYLQQNISYGPSGLVMTQKSSLFGEKQFAYDPLNQLIREENTTYAFDSVGNPTQCEVNEYNQILSTEDASLTYDPDGNPLKRTTKEQAHTYTYDALGRLTSIDDKVHYTYDPLSRLLEKNTPDQTRFYLYDNLQEIGTCDPSLHILELKILGLGIQGDIGAAVAIELESRLFAPLHDFSGHIIALIGTDAKLFESYPIDAFGKTTLTTPSLNPWRFSSKRSEEGFIFFGARFYDPALGRFLTPDPAGFTEGPNLYLYVLNNPLNRLDLFGLVSFSFGPPANPYPFPFAPPTGNPYTNGSIAIPISAIPTHGNERVLIPCRGRVGQVEEHYVVSLTSSTKLKISAEELRRGQFNLFDHMHELVPKEGALVGLITAQNGILTTPAEFKDNCDLILKNVPEATLFIGKYNMTKGPIKDLHRVHIERSYVETLAVSQSRQFMEAIAMSIHKINPDVLWAHVSHSEGGLLCANAIKGMTPDKQALLKQHFYSISLGPARPISNEHTFKAVNLYSEKDYITGRYGKELLGDKNYDIKFLKCKSSMMEKTMYFADHKFQGPTYQEGLGKELGEVRRFYPFYDPKTR